MKNNFTPVPSFYQGETEENSEFVRLISSSIKRNVSRSAKKATIQSLLWYASSLEVRATKCGCAAEMVLN